LEWEGENERGGGRVGEIEAKGTNSEGENERGGRVEGVEAEGTESEGENERG
jgi:hypothetical protein